MVGRYGWQRKGRGRGASRMYRMARSSQIILTQRASWAPVCTQEFFSSSARAVASHCPCAPPLPLAFVFARFPCFMASGGAPASPASGLDFRAMDEDELRTMGYIKANFDDKAAAQVGSTAPALPKRARVDSAAASGLPPSPTYGILCSERCMKRMLLERLLPLPVLLRAWRTWTRRPLICMLHMNRQNHPNLR